jgi:hypothetical protein
MEIHCQLSFLSVVPIGFLSKKLRERLGGPAMELGWKGEKAVKRDPAP